MMLKDGVDYDFIIGTINRKMINDLGYEAGLLTNEDIDHIASNIYTELKSVIREKLKEQCEKRNLTDF